MCSLSTSITRPSGAGGRRRARSRPSHARSVTSNTPPRRLEAVSSGPKRRKFAAGARSAASHRAGSRRARAWPRWTCAPARRPQPRSRGSPAARGRASSRPSVGVRVRAHPALAGRRQRRELRAERAALVEELLGSVAAQPLLELCQVLGVRAHGRQRHLVGPEGALRRQPSTSFGPGPALGCAQDDHGPARPGRSRSRGRPPAGSRRISPTASSSASAIRRCIVSGSLALDEQRAVAVAGEQLPRAPPRDARQHRRVGDLVAVQVEDRQHGAVARAD